MSLPENPSVAVARAESEAAKARLKATVEELKLRLNPKLKAKDAWDSAVDGAWRGSEELVEGARERPAAAAGIGVALALLLFRRPVVRRIGALWNRQKPAPPEKVPDQHRAHA